MEIAWFVSDLRIDGEKFDSSIASVRLRCLEPVRELTRLHGASVSLVHLKPDMQIDQSLFSRTDIAVFGKIFHDWEPLYRELRQHGVPIVADICDDVFGLPHLKKNYATLLRYCTAVVASSDSLQNLIQERLGDRPSLIPDALDGERMAPSFSLNEAPLRLAWFGQPANLAPLLGQMEELGRSEAALHLDVVTRLDNTVAAQLETARTRFPALAIDAHPWSLERQNRQLAACHAVIVPASDERRYQVKTANRLMTALWAGKPVVAHPLPSYREFSAYAVLSASMLQGLQYLLTESPEHTVRQIRNGQDYIAQRYGTVTVAAKWAAFLGGIQATSAPTIDVADNEPVRLNLGCADKVLPGYINVDLAQERRGNRPDVICDVRDLKVFADDFADEILAVHVIEHFYHWEAVPLVTEWVRVLKPGGTLIVECPNLLSACQEILNNPESAGPGAEGARGMWPLYGDPIWQDPLMCHKWLYTPRSLGELLSRCGMIDITQQAAQHKMREPRDMRLVGKKPTSNE